jgi:cysteine synthase A
MVSTKDYLISISLISLGLILVNKCRTYLKKHLKKPNVKGDILEMMKHTPLIYIKSLSELTGCKIYGKCEYFMPYTSKDRMIKNIILDAKR